MTTQAMPHEPSLKMAEMSDEKLADFFFAKVFTDDEPAGEPPTIPKERWQLTPTELEFIRAAASPAQRQRKGGRTMVDRWTGICDIDRMAELVRREPALLQSVGPLLIRATVSMHGCAPSTKFLLDHGVPMIISERGYNCLHEAVWTGTCIENLRYVFESGAADAAGVSILKPHTGWPDNISLLYWAAASRDGVALTKLLLQFGADPEVRFKGNGERGNTALQEAVAPGGSEWMRGKRQTARVLIEWGAHYDVLSACALDDLDRVRECAADLDLASFVGEADMTPLHWAARAGSLTCAEWLLKRGADVNAVTASKRTPLHLAAERGAVGSLWLLSDYGADLNAQDTKGRTPLHRATYEGQVDSAEALIVLGASTRIQGKSGKNPLEVARLDCKYLRS